MTPQKTNNDELAKNLAASLRSTTELIQSLLGEIRDNATTLAVLREKLDNLGKSVDNLTAIVSKGNGKGSLVTRFTLMESELEELEEKIEKYKEQIEAKTAVIEKAKIENEGLEKKKSIEIVKTIGIITPGALSLIYILVNSVFG